MLQFLAELAIYEVPRGFGWAILKVVTLGRYRGSYLVDCVTEGAEASEARRFTPAD